MVTQPELNAVMSAQFFFKIFFYLYASRRCSSAVQFPGNTDIRDTPGTGLGGGRSGFRRERVGPERFLRSAPLGTEECVRA